MLETPRLFIVPANLPMLEAIANDDLATLSALLGGVDTAEGWLQFSETMIWMRDFLLEHPDQLGWWNYLIIHRSDRRLIGTCGFKGPPAIEDSVEIGYEVAPRYQNQGLATEAAQALCDFAFSQPDIQAVTAHTLAEENPSTALLRRLGFAFTGEFVDIEDGVIWGWRKERNCG